ncbi:hypothetical protein INQ20_28590, partial [Escherichia coli]
RRYLAADRGELRWFFYAVAAGLTLALLAHLYIAAIELIPSIAKATEASRLQMDSIPGMATAYAVIAIAFAPFAEEYL